MPQARAVLVGAGSCRAGVTGAGSCRAGVSGAGSDRAGVAGYRHGGSGCSLPRLVTCQLSSDSWCQRVADVVAVGPVSPSEGEGRHSCAAGSCVRDGGGRAPQSSLALRCLTCRGRWDMLHCRPWFVVVRCRNRPWRGSAAVPNVGVPTAEGQHGRVPFTGADAGVCARASRSWRVSVGSSFSRAALHTLRVFLK